MNTYRHHITVFEHERIKLGQVFSVGSTLGETLTKEIVFDESKLFALQKYYGDKGVPYFSLIHKGVQFNEYVGVIQVGDLLIEVLPKADKVKHSVFEDKKWRNMLIDMMRAVGTFDIRVTSSTHLKIKPNTVLDLYIEMFINEVEYLLHTGFIKQYRKKEGNVTALKGNLIFGKHIQQNLTHQERFYVRHTNYDIEHQFHFILYTAILFIKQINTNATLHSRIGALLLFFPEMPTVKVTETTFEKLVFNRKSEGYRKAIEIAKLLLLQYHPDVSKGRNNVLALMFDMNKLWEQFVYVSLRKHNENFTITSQTSKYFWQPENGYRSKIRPDIVIDRDTDNCIVIDTKWKNLNGYNPSPDDLRQMYVYHDYYNAKQVALVYPGDSISIKGTYLDRDTGEKSIKECYLLTISIENNIRNWQKSIYNNLVKQCISKNTFCKNEK
ncbi:MAG: McrC family protein [Bacteroidia bacterium]